MNFSRAYHTLMLRLQRGGCNRANYLRKHGVFGAIGTQCMIMSRKVPLYPRLIKLGNNVWIASDVCFITHDVTHAMLRRIKPGTIPALPEKKPFSEKAGCIEVGNNVFIGSESILMYNTRIGSNCIIAAGSIVTKDVPDNSVVAGVPAKVIGSFNDYVNKRLNEEKYPLGITPEGNEKEFAEWAWKRFYEQRKENE